MMVERDGLSLVVHRHGPDRDAGDSGDASDGDASQVPVLALHGFPQVHRCWDRVLPGLVAAGRTVLVPELRGYSPTARPTAVSAYSLELLLGDVLAVVDAAGAAQVDLLGHDWGAILAWAMAAYHPERVRSLVAVSVPHPRAFAAALAHDEDQQRRSAYIRLFRETGKAELVLLADGSRRLREMFAGSGLSAAEVSVHVDPLSDPQTLTAALAWYRAMSADEYARVPPVRVPTTYVWGEQDIAVGPAAAHGCAEHVLGPFRFVPLPHVSHWVPEQSPDALVRAALDPPH